MKGEYFVVVSEPRIVGIDQEWIESNFPEGRKSIRGLVQMLASYRSRDEQDALPGALKGRRIKFVTRKEMEAMFAGDAIGGWSRFWQAYPDARGLVNLSLPGYSPDGMWAIVGYSISRGSLAGEVRAALLSRDDSGRWAVEWSAILVQS
jgi:hypothetical protein